MFDPMLLIMLLTLSLSPRTIDEIPMTTATPITIPRTVRPERSLLLRMVSSAIVMISPNSLLLIIDSGPPYYREERQLQIPRFARDDNGVFQNCKGARGRGARAARRAGPDTRRRKCPRWRR